MKASVLRCLWVVSMVAIVAGGGAILASAGTEYFTGDGPRPFWSAPTDIGGEATREPIRSRYSTPPTASQSTNLTGRDPQRPPPRHGGILLLAGLGLWLITISMLWAGRNPLQVLGRRFVEADQQSARSV
jgi:hypothetical protein